MNQKQKKSDTFTLSLFSVLMVLMFGLLMFSGGNASPRLWGYAGFVHCLPSTDSFLTKNMFSFTSPDELWVNHEWLSMFIIYHFHAALGNAGLMSLKIFLGFFLSFILYRSIRKNTATRAVRVFLIMLTVSIIGTGFELSSQVFTWIMFAWMLKLLLKPHTSLWLPLATLALGCLWANLNGAFYLGLILLVVAMLCSVVEAIKNRAGWQPTLTLASASCSFFLGSLFTPYGLHLWAFVIRSVGLIQPPLIGNQFLAPLVHALTYFDFWILLSVTFTAITVSFPYLKLFSVCILLLSATASFFGQNFVPLFPVAAAILASKEIGQLLQAPLNSRLQKYPKKWRKRIPIATTAVFLIALVVRNSDGRPTLYVPLDKFPVRAIEFLNHNAIDANALIYVDWSDYAIIKLSPKIHVFLDSRLYAAYPKNIISTYLDFVEGRNPAALLRYPVDLVLIPHTSPAAKHMQSREGWTLVYEDNLAVVFLKNDTHADILRLHGLGMLYVPGDVSTAFP